MRILLAMAAFAALTVSAFAQPPQEIVSNDTIRLQPGDARVFTFDQPVSKVHLSADDVLQVVPDTDHVFSFRALKHGTVLLTAYGENGRVIHRVNITVAGRMVKLYGTLKRLDPKDYVGFICTEYTCGRADPDKSKDAKSESVSVTTREQSGDIVTTTKNY